MNCAARQKEEEGAPKNDRNGRHWENTKPSFHLRRKQTR
jgi:hypothetical protein